MRYNSLLQKNGILKKTTFSDNIRWHTITFQRKGNLAPNCYVTTNDKRMPANQMVGELNRRWKNSKVIIHYYELSWIIRGTMKCAPLDDDIYYHEPIRSGVGLNNKCREGNDWPEMSSVDQNIENTYYLNIGKGQCPAICYLVVWKWLLPIYLCISSKTNGKLTRGQGHHLLA